MLWYKDGKRVRFADEKETEGSEGEGENTESDTEQSQDGDDSEQEGNLWPVHTVPCGRKKLC